MKKRSFLVRLSGALCLFLACVSILTPRAAAQQFLPLLTWTNAWRYDQSGTDLGTAWRESAFDDSSWPAGLPIFGVELGVPFPYAAAGFNSMTTPLDLIGPGQSAQTITYYFRTHFNFPWTNLTGVVLTATAYADDGCVLYLNGSESGRARISPGQNWQTLTTTTATEGSGIRIVHMIKASPRGLHARQAIRGLDPGGQLSLIRYQNGQAVLDGERGVASGADQRHLFARESGFAKWVEWATECSEESIVHGDIV